jgi:hypothetical protein
MTQVVAMERLQIWSPSLEVSILFNTDLMSMNSHTTGCPVDIHSRALAANQTSKRRMSAARDWRYPLADRSVPGLSWWLIARMASKLRRGVLKGQVM